MINVANCFCKRERRRDTERWSLPFAVVSVTRLGYFWKVLATKFPTKETRNTRWLFELFFKQKLSTKNRLILGSGCGSVGRAVASNSGGPWFESSHQQKFILNIYCQLKKTTKIKKKRPGMAHFLKNRQILIPTFGNTGGYCDWKVVKTSFHEKTGKTVPFCEAIFWLKLYRKNSLTLKLKQVVFPSVKPRTTSIEIWQVFWILLSLEKP